MLVLDGELMLFLTAPLHYALGRRERSGDYIERTRIPARISTALHTSSRLPRRRLEFSNRSILVVQQGIKRMPVGPRP
jgi:hypothetical protein